MIEHAQLFRQCLEELKPHLGIQFQRFPCRACGDTSRLLGQWLTECGVENLVYVCGHRGSASHAWLEHDSTNVIDITADQFDDGPGPVYVGPVSDFHRSFSDDIRRGAHCLDELIQGDYELCRSWMVARHRA